MKYFSDTEFQCKCSNGENGGSCGMDVTEELKDVIVRARHLAQTPFIINSGARCETHNDAVGGTKGSAHTKGLAVDIKASDSRSRYVIMDALRKAGFTRIGINFDKGFIHADIARDKAQNVLFGY